MDDHFERMLEPLGGGGGGIRGAKTPAFHPAKSWQGPRPGFVFKRGPRGVGYYEDAEEQRKAKEQGLLDGEGGGGGGGAAKRRRVDEEGGAVAAEEGGDGAEEEDEAELLKRALESDEIDEETIRRILEAADKQQDVVELDLPGVKRLFLGLEKKVQANLLKRVKFADEPAKFLDAELELYEEIGNFKAVAAAPALYPELVKLDVASTLLGLVTHENTDISIAALGLLGELTDPDVILEAEKEAGQLVEALVEKNGLELLVQNLQRMDESREEDAKGVHATLQVLENLCVVRPSLCSLVCERTAVLKVLLGRCKAKRFDEVKGYAAEMLAILLAADTENQRRLGQLAGMDGMDTLLQAIAYYRRRDAGSPEERECVENLFDALCSALLVPENQARFRQSEGVDLLLRCLRERKGGFLGAVKALDSALLNSVPNCEKLVELGGLKAVFPLFMGRGWGAALKGKRQGEREALTEQVASTVASLCMLLMHVPEAEAKEKEEAENTKVVVSAREVAEARLLSKFGEGEGEKVDRAVELFVKYHAKVEAARARAAEAEAFMEGEGLSEEERAEARLERLLDAGLYMLQRVCVVLGFVFTRSAEGRARMKKRMRMEGKGLGLVADVLREYAASLGEDAPGAALEGGGVAVQRKRLRLWAAQLDAESMPPPPPPPPPSSAALGSSGEGAAEEDEANGGSGEAGAAEAEADAEAAAGAAVDNAEGDEMAKEA